MSGFTRVRPYIAAAQAEFRSRSAFRNELWTSWVGIFLIVIARSSIWEAIRDEHAFGPNSEANMMSYAIIGTGILSCLDYSRIIREISLSLKTGDITTVLAQPISYIPYLLAQCFGRVAFRLIFVSVPVISSLLILFGAPHVGVCEIATFCILFLISMLILFCIAALFGIAAFWILDSNSLEWSMSGLLALLSGTVVPLWLFPDEIAAFVHILPTAWIAFYPTSIMIGATSDLSLALIILGGITWTAILATLLGFVWTRARTRIVVHGG